MGGPAIHASAFSYEGAGCLILGDSGSGKSTLLAEAMLRGAKLVADDRVALRAQDGQLIADPVAPLHGVMELRGFGLIKQEEVVEAQVIHLAIALDAAANERLPEPSKHRYYGVNVPFLSVPPPPVISAARLLIYLKAVQEGRSLPVDWHPLA